MAEGTLQTLRDALWDNAGFEESGSTTEAKAFITAATRYLVLEPAQSADQGSSMAMAPAQIESLLQRARQYVAENQTASATTSRVRFLSAGDGFRR